MTTEPLTRLVHNLSRTLVANDLAELPDAELLSRFRRSRDPAAFEAIVNRHGPRVLAACRAVLRNEADIEDAFQATFVILMRNPRAVRRPSALGSWLFGVAHRVALQARAGRQRRERIEARVAPKHDTTPDLTWHEACAILHEELGRLPDRQRLPLLLCYLEGLARDEAATRLGRTLGSVKQALEAGREALRKRLERRGVTLSAGLLAAVAQPVDGSSVSSMTAPIVGGTIRPGAIALSRAVRFGSHLRTMGVGLAATVLIVGVVFGFPGGPKADPPKEVPTPAKPVAKANTPTDDGPKGERIAFSGRVVDPDGKAVKGAKVFLMRYGDKTPETRVDPVPKSTSGSGGEFEFDVSVINYAPKWWRNSNAHLVALSDGFGMGITPIGEKGGDGLQIQLTRDIPLEGRILGLEGKPIVGATIAVKNVFAGKTDVIPDWLLKGRDNYPGDLLLHVFSGDDLPRKLGVLKVPHPALPVAKTDANGKFAISGLGRERVVWASVDGPNIASAHFLVFMQAGPSGVFPPPKNNPTIAGQAYYRPPFGFVVAPDQVFDGRVTDRESGAPIAGVTVRYDDRETKTDVEGKYRLTGLSSGPKELAFFPGNEVPYHTCSAFGGVKDSIQPVRLDAALLRAPWVVGRVIDEKTRKPIAGALIAYKPDRENKRALDYFAKHVANVQVRSGLDGTFRLAGVPGKGWLFVSWEAASLSAAERPIQGDTTAKDPPNEVHTSDESGRGTSPRAYQALVALDIDPKAAKEYTVTLDSGMSVPATLTDPDGKQLAAVRVLGIADHWSKWSGPLARAKLEVPAFNPARPRSLLFLHPDRNLGLLLNPKVGDGGPWEVKLQPTATVAGRLVLPDGKPYPNATLNLSFKYPGQSGPVWPPHDLPVAQTKTDADGKFRLTNIIGDVQYDVWYHVFNDKYGTSIKIPFTAKSGEKKDLGDVKTSAPRE